MLTHTHYLLATCALLKLTCQSMLTHTHYPLASYAFKNSTQDSGPHFVPIISLSSISLCSVGFKFWRSFASLDQEKKKCHKGLLNYAAIHCLNCMRMTVHIGDKNNNCAKQTETNCGTTTQNHFWEQFAESECWLHITVVIASSQNWISGIDLLFWIS